MIQNSILVISFKFNEILYSLSTDEYKNAEVRKLLILYTGKNIPENYPLQDRFDEVKYIKYHNLVKEQYHNIIELFRIREFLRADIVMTCNPILLAVKFIARLSHAKTAVWLEDGLMNYYPIKDIVMSSPQNLKHIVERLIGATDINKRKDIELISYVLSPENAVSVWGKVKKIVFDPSEVKDLPIDKLSFLQGKKIFVGQDMSASISQGEYIELVNRVVKKYDIDYYLEHLFTVDVSGIKCKTISLNNYGITMEFIACKYDFEIYSIASTLLYSTKLLNPRIKSHMVRCKGCNPDIHIINKCIDDVVDSE